MRGNNYETTENRNHYLFSISTFNVIQSIVDKSKCENILNVNISSEIICPIGY